MKTLMRCARVESEGRNIWRRGRHGKKVKKEICSLFTFSVTPLCIVYVSIILLKLSLPGSAVAANYPHQPQFQCFHCDPRVLALSFFSPVQIVQPQPHYPRLVFAAVLAEALTALCVLVHCPFLNLFTAKTNHNSPSWRQWAGYQAQRRWWRASSHCVFCPA